MSTLRVVPGQPVSLTDRVAGEVRAQMARVRVSQVQLAQLLDLPQSSISARLRGKTPFRVDELEQVADALGVHPATLLGVHVSGSGPSPSGGLTEPYLSKKTTGRDRNLTSRLRVMAAAA